MSDRHGALSGCDFLSVIMESNQATAGKSPWGSISVRLVEVDKGFYMGEPLSPCIEAESTSDP